MEEILPEGWVLAKVGDIADVIEPGFPHGRYNTEGIGIPHLRPMNIDGQGRLSLDEIKSVDVDNPPRLHAGDILFNNTNSPVWVGKTTVITQGEQYTFSNHMTRVTLNPHAGCSQFFALQLQYMQQSGYFLERCVHHVNQASIASSYLAKNVDLLVAPVSEQDRIVAAIEQQFTRLDNAVASLQSAKRRVKQYRASLLKSAVEGELTKEWRAEHPANETGAQLLARIVVERRALWEEEQLRKMREKRITPKDNKWRDAYKEPQRPNVENLPSLPEGWCWATLEQCSRRITDGTHEPPQFVEKGIPFIFVKHIVKGQISFEDTKYIAESTYQKLNSRCPVEVGDVLYSAVGSYGVAVPVLVPHPFSFQRHIAHIKPSLLLNLNYLVICLNSSIGLEQAHRVARGVAQKTVTLTDLARFVIPLPPFTEQEQIVAEVEARLSNVAQLEVAIEANLKRAEHERQSILLEAFAGRLVPQDPTDEPASALLERIREERKKREEAEKLTKASRKGFSMNTARRSKARKTGASQQEVGLYETLVEAGHPLSPDELFKQAGLKTDEQPESVEVFYEELHPIENTLIRETRPDYEHVLLEALEPPAEALTHVLEEEEPIEKLSSSTSNPEMDSEFSNEQKESVEQPQRAEQSKKIVDQPTLWGF